MAQKFLIICLVFLVASPHSEILREPLSHGHLTVITMASYLVYSKDFEVLCQELRTETSVYYTIIFLGQNLN